jgi:IS605 OrfB family transposase
MPSYLRRSAITHALGAVSSYRTRLVQWEEDGRKGTSPVLGEKTHAMPVFYRGNMYREGEGDTAFLKLYNGKDWVWVRAALLHTDMEYLRKHWTGVKASAPTLEKRHRKYFLRFSYEENRELADRPVQEQRICAVDLGLNTDAVCSIMEADGTVCARKFIDFADEKDRLWKVLNRIRRKNREHGPESAGSLWKYAVRCNGELSKKTAAAIVRFAQENNADVIVFEHLDMQGKIRGKRKMRLHIWKKRGVQKICTHMAHRKGMRVSRVCAWKTSALAYDGSGEVERDPGNHSLCTFGNGKRYNCDLSASYNIGARYFIRELTKPMPATAWSVLEAEVPAVRRRSSCVHADLVRLSAVMRENGWTA